MIVLRQQAFEVFASHFDPSRQRFLADTVERLVGEKASISGVIITSAKKTFFAGGDLYDDDRVSVSLQGLNSHRREGRQVLVRLLYGSAGLLLIYADDFTWFLYAKDQLPTVRVCKCGDVFRDDLRGGY